jgi:hypothetical protein
MGWSTTSHSASYAAYELIAVIIGQPALAAAERFEAALLMFSRAGSS